MGRKVKDLTGQRFGRLVVIKDSGKRYQSFVIWDCLCDCGTVTTANTGVLSRGHKRSCGCLLKEPVNKINHIGKEYGRLTVVKETPKRVGGSTVWKCLCACGNYTEVDSRNLVTGNTQSCGCLQKEWTKSMSDMGRKAAYKHNKKENWKEETYLSMLTMEKPKNNKSGIKGVFWHTEKQIWCAKIGFQNQKIFLGYFSKLEDAAKARKEAEEKYFTPILEKYGRLEESK